MDSKTYIENAIRTESIIERAVVNDAELFNNVLQAFVASARLLDMYKKHIYYGKPIDPQKWETSAIVLHDVGYELETTELDELPPVGDELTVDTRILHAVIGIATEAGELMEATLDGLTSQTPLDTVNLAEEVGDLNWYEAVLLDALNADWDEVRERNIAKLRARYPDKFDSDKAINRDLEKEREILEGNTAEQLLAAIQPPQEVICEVCGGRGEVPVVTDDHGHYGFMQQCSQCKGRGYYLKDEQ